jgi:hypothetical protein
MVFDVLQIGDHVTTSLPWSERRQLLESLADELPSGMRLSRVFTDGVALFEAAERQGLEGLVAQTIRPAVCAGPTEPRLGDYVQTPDGCRRCRPRARHPTQCCLDSTLGVGVRHSAGGSG